MHDDAILDRIFMIAERLIVFDGLDDVFEHIVKTAATLTRAEAASLCVFDLPSGMLKIAKAHGADDALLAQVPVRLGEGIAGHVVRTGRPFTTADVAGEPLCENPQLARAAGIRALLCVPMNTRAGTIGCITAYRKGEDAFSEHDLLLLSLFASEAVEAAEKERLLRELKALATQDSVTGLLSKRAFMERLAAEMQRARRHAQELAVLFIDLDGFKRYNDAHGHLMGDKLLYDFAGVLRRHCRTFDVPGRFGGDEFVVIAPQTDADGARALAWKLARAVAGHRFRGHADADYALTCSVGAALMGDGASDAAELLSRADAALYASKREGKNRITLWRAAA